MNQNIDFLGICQLLKSLLILGFTEKELRKIASRVAVKLGADITIFP